MEWCRNSSQGSTRPLVRPLLGVPLPGSGVSFGDCRDAIVTPKGALWFPWGKFRRKNFVLLLEDMVLGSHQMLSTLVTDGEHGRTHGKTALLPLDLFYLPCLAECLIVLLLFVCSHLHHCCIECSHSWWGHDFVLQTAANKSLTHPLFLRTALPCASFSSTCLPQFPSCATV